MTRKKKNKSKYRLSCVSMDSNIKLQRLVNYLMIDGKKTKAEKIVCISLSNAHFKCKKSKVLFLERIISNIKPQYEVKSRRIGGSTYQIPIEVKTPRSITLALKWLVNAAKKRCNKKKMCERLTIEMCEAFYNKGGAVKKMEDTHKMAEANQAFAHYRW